MYYAFHVASDCAFVLPVRRSIDTLGITVRDEIDSTQYSLQGNIDLTLAGKDIEAKTRNRSEA